MKYGGLVDDLGYTLSPSSRRAWIEITNSWVTRGEAKRSPSSRRAWIEIQPSPSLNQRGDVALLAEGVD